MLGVGEKKWIELNFRSNLRAERVTKKVFFFMRHQTVEFELEADLSEIFRKLGDEQHGTRGDDLTHSLLYYTVIALFVTAMAYELVATFLRWRGGKQTRYSWM